MTVSQDKADSELQGSIRDFFSRDTKAAIVLLHGSFASGRQREESDVDLAVLCDYPMTTSQLIEISQDLGSLLKREVDLIDLATCHGAILQESLVRGKQILLRDPERLSALIKRMWYEREDDARFSAKTIAERRAHWDRSIKI